MIVPAPEPFATSSVQTTRRRAFIPLITLAAAAAGFGAGHLIDSPDSWVPTVILGAVAALAILASARTSVETVEQVHVTWLDAFRQELDRARRHRRSFALLRLPFVAEPNVEAAGVVLGKTEMSELLVGAALRITDLAWVDEGGLVVLLPESDRATADALADRIRAASPNRFAARVGIAAFPDDGLTSGALLDALDRNAHGQPVPSPIVRTVAAPSVVAGPSISAGGLLIVESTSTGDDVESGTG